MGRIRIDQLVSVSQKQYNSGSLRIIIFVDSFPSLSETFISNKVNQLSEKGMHIIVFCVHHNAKLFHKLFAGNGHVEIVVLNKIRLLKFLLLHPFLLLRSLFKIGQFRQRLFRRFRLSTIRKCTPDIVHFEFSGIGVDYLYEIKHLDCKKVVSCRGSAEKVKLLVHEERKEKFTELLTVVDAIHCVSADMRATILSYCSNPEKIFINYPSIDTSFFKKPLVVEKNTPVITILSVGRFTFQKGFNTGLLAVKILKKSGSAFKWCIVGSGPDYEEIVYQLHYLGLHDVVELAGSKSSAEIKVLMSAADIYFLPSVYEGVANVALEAMSMELPVVATRSGGMEEVITDGVNGLLSDVYDHEALAAQLLLLLHDNALRIRLGAAATLTIRERFDLRIQTTIYEKVYAAMLQHDSKPAPQDADTSKDAATAMLPVRTKSRQPLHIGIIVPEFPTISETFFVNKIIGLCMRGHTITVFGSTRPADTSIQKIYALSDYENLHVTHLDFKNSVYDFLKALVFFPVAFAKSFHINMHTFRRRLHINLCKAYINKYHCDIYHFGYSGTAIFYHSLFDLLKGKIMISCRGTAENVKLVTEKERVHKLKKLFKKTDKIHCVSGSMAKTIQSYGAPPEKIFINHPAIDTAFFSRSNPYTAHEQLIILSIGRLVFQKGFIIGILAIQQLKKQFPYFIWKIVGDGPEMEELTSHIYALGLSEHVQLLGKKNRHEIKRLYDEADIYFLPSVSEGLANAVLEGMSMGIPVVSSDVGGMGEAITHNVDGKLCHNYDHKEMTEQLLELCTNFELRKKLGEAARKTAVDKFDIKRYIDVFEEMYYAMLE